MSFATPSRMYQGEDIQLIKSIKMYLDNNVDDIHLKLLDLSDKLSDYYPLLKGIDIHNEIINALDEKKDYVKWRYGRDGAGEDSIERDFNKAKIFSTEIFGFNQSEVLTI